MIREGLAYIAALVFFTLWAANRPDARMTKEASPATLPKKPANSLKVLENKPASTPPKKPYPEIPAAEWTRKGDTYRYVGGPTNKWEVTLVEEESP